MFKNIIAMLNTKSGKYLISIIFGIGLACIFRKSCQSRHCLHFKGPDIDTVKNNVYKYNNKCYIFKESAVTCKPKQRKQVRFE